ncbi:MAG: hypothetical protein E6H47_02430 [Betaproteobacteria bacterium]|nr:MAG: hypothetical protein E6H47_02430 [Betaproteobacteria bacterium]
MIRVLLLIAVLGLAACAERPAWDNAPLAYGGKWTKGDRVSWENQIKTRQLGQNEDVRISQ